MFIIKSFKFFIAILLNFVHLVNIYLLVLGLDLRDFCFVSFPVSKFLPALDRQGIISGHKSNFEILNFIL